MLDRPQQPESVVAVAFEGQDGVDQVLEHPGPGQAPVLGDVADQEHGEGPTLGLADQPMGALAHLYHRAGGRPQIGVEHGLDGIDDHEVGLHLVEPGDERGEIGFTGQPQGIDKGIEALGPQPHLLERLFGRHVQHPRPRAGPGRGELEQQG